MSGGARSRWTHARAPRCTHAPVGSRGDRTGSGGAGSRPRTRRCRRRTAARTRSRVAVRADRAAPAGQRGSGRSRRAVQREPRPQQTVGVRVGRACRERPPWGRSRRSGPPYSTAMRSAICAATPRSWVMSTMLQPISSRRRLRSSSTWACTVTSSAVVGSSATISSGRPRSRSRSSRAAADRRTVRAGRPASAAWDRGCRRRSSSLSAFARSPADLGDLLADPHRGVQRGHRVLEHRAEVRAPAPPCDPWPFARDHVDALHDRRCRRLGAGLVGSSPSIVNPSTLLPEPDSPTRPTISPGAISSETPRSACTVLVFRVKDTARSAIDTIGRASVAPGSTSAGSDATEPSPVAGSDARCSTVMSVDRTRRTLPVDRWGVNGPCSVSDSDLALRGSGCGRRWPAPIRTVDTGLPSRFRTRSSGPRSGRC